MANLILHAHSGPDGVLRLAVPVEVPGAAYDVQVTLSPSQQTSPASPTSPPAQTGQTAPMTSEQWRAWRAFITQTAGSLADDPIERPSQGEYEQREPIE